MSSNQHNPYAAPAATFDAGHADSCYRDGKNFVIPFGATVPERCVKCDAPAELEKVRSYSWHHPAWYLAILLSPLIYIIVGLLARKRGKVAVAVCERHRARNRNLVLASWGAFLLAIGSAFVSGSVESGGPFVGVALLATLLVLVLYFSARLLYPTRISDAAIHLGGCGKAFLDGLDRRG